jgi:hypothetical protein
MKRKNDNLSHDDSATQLDENISRLLKLAGESNKPSRTFAESLTDSALNELRQLEVGKKNEKYVIVKSHWLEKTMGWAAMIAVGCGTGLTVLVSVALKMNFFLQAILILTMFFNWLTYLGGRIL